MWRVALSGTQPSFYARHRESGTGVKQMRLRNRLLLLVLLSILPALAVLFYNYVEARAARLRQLDAEALRLAQFASGELDRITEAIHVQMSAVALLPSLANDRQACASYLTTLAERSESILTFTLTDRSGLILCSSHSLSALAISQLTLSDRVYFEEAKETRRFVIAPAVVSRFTKKLVLPLALPLINANGEFDGVVSVGMDLQWLSNYFAAKPLPPNGTIVLADREGTIIVRVPSWPGIVGTPLSASVRWMLKAAKAGTGNSDGRDGIQRIAAYVPPSASPNGLFVAVGIAKQSAMADINRAAWRGGLTLALLLMIALVAALLGGRAFIEQPISLLTAVARKWRDGDLAARAKISERNPELSHLASIFNSMAGKIQDREEALRQALHHQEVLIQELNHRVKNSLAVVQALAQQSMRGAESKDDAVKAFLARLVTFASAHDILTEQAWEGAELRNVIGKVVIPHCSDGSRLTMKGPPIRLTAKQTLAISMALHELCTNAVKHGALSTKNGQICLEWTVKVLGEQQTLQIHWKESGGPVVRPPNRRGFGSHLIEDVLAVDLSGAVKLDFAPTGLECTIEAPIESKGTTKLYHGAQQKTSG
jgi:two-component sensor histidine kinase